MNSAFLNYFRCPQADSHIKLGGELSRDSGFFQWGRDILCYGRSACGYRTRKADGDYYDVSNDSLIQDSTVDLPFDPLEVIENLQRERYAAHFREEDSWWNALVRAGYYLVRPYLTVPMRRHMQRFRLRDWSKIPFPNWPVDFTVDRIQQRLMALHLQARGVDRLPFIWFWPDNYRSCAIITHDVEEPGGRDFCGRLMDIDASFGFRSSFQVVPEDRYAVSNRFLNSITDRGFEVNVHDLKHDGRLYAEHSEFLRRAKAINEYGRDFGAKGFRSGVLYRNADWYDALDFEYDMSIPNVAHLDPQRGGCCTVMPFFIGNMIELPITCTQDYSLFNILNDYSIDLWKQQIEMIRANHGLISVLVHPDYVMESRAQNCYKDLLGYMSDLRDNDSIWTPLPKDVADWWRQRSQMQLVFRNGEWQIEGEGKERACIAYASPDGDGISYILPDRDVPFACHGAIPFSPRKKRSMTARNASF